jgi:chemotaxis protein methyltransferase CheR
MKALSLRTQNKGKDGGWFLDHHAFEALRNTVIPECLERVGDGKRLRIWSAACSTGQEPYTIAMILKHNFPAVWDGKAEILATDPNPDNIAKATSGIYDQDEVSLGLPALFLAKYLESDGNRWRVSSEIRKGIDFQTLNLARPFHLPPELDILFIRGVLKPSARERNQAVLARVTQRLKPGGFLFLGAEESIFGLDLPLLRVSDGKTVYFRKRE